MSPPDADDQADIREQVRAHYAAAATSAHRVEEETEFCGTDGPVRFGARLYAESDRAGLPQGAVEASLGCGNPTAVASLRPGDTVLDLGSGGGIDLLLSARRVGNAGKVYGLDMTEEMLTLARRNLRDAGVTNVELLKGKIEAIPLPASTVNVVISNCVVNLSTDKPAVFAEAFRVLKPGGRLGISDVVADDDLMEVDRAERGSRSGCIAGALSAGEYRDALEAVGFNDVAITLTHEVADRMHGAIIQATKPGRPGAFEADIGDMQPSDWPDVRNIYEQGTATGHATFETTAPDWQTWDAAHLAEPRLVARATNEVVGWAALSPVSGHCIHTGVAETSIYVAVQARGHGVGRQLLAELVDRAERSGIWTLQAEIFPENSASLALHHACGFRTVGVRERIGELKGRWRDVVLLERRSDTVA